MPSTPLAPKAATEFNEAPYAPVSYTHLDVYKRQGYTCDAAQIRRAAGQCLKRAPLERRLRLLGVRVGGLVRSDSPAARLADAQPPDVLSLF